VNNLRRDHFYDIADPNGALDYQKQYFLYNTTHRKAEKWMSIDTHSIGTTQILKHTQFSLDEAADYGTESEAKLNRYGALYIDFDFKADPSLAIKDMQQAIQTLLELGVEAAGIHAFVSGGKGAFLFIDSRILGTGSTSGHPRLIEIHGCLVKKVFGSLKTVDYNVYKGSKKGRLVRTANTMRDTGLYRARIDTVETLNLSAEAILEKTKTNGLAIVYPTHLPSCNKLSDIFEIAKKEVESEKKSKASLISKNVSRNTSLPAQVSEPKCIRIFNEENLKDINPEKSFNYWAFLAASLVSESDDNNAISQLTGFLKNYRSNSYPDEQNRHEHLVSQLQRVRSESENVPFCNAIRDSIKSFPCSGCEYLNMNAYAMGNKYFIDQYGISRESKNEKNYDNIFISNGIAFTKSKKTIFKEDGRTKGSVFEFEIHTKQRSYLVDIDVENLSSNDVLEKTVNNQTGGAVMFSSQEKKPAVQLFQIARNLPALNPEIKLFDKIGFAKNGGYIFPNVIIFGGNLQHFGQEIVKIPDFSKAKYLKWKDFPKEIVSIALKKSIDAIRTIHEDRIALSGIAFSILPLFNNILKPGTRFYLLIRGASGDSKTTILKFMCSFWGEFHLSGSMQSASATANRIEVEGGFFGDSLYMIDDVKEANISNISAFRRIIQNYADMSPRTRLNSNSSMQSSEPIVGYIAITGEDSFAGSESSILARGLELEVKFVKKDKDVIDILEVQRDYMLGVLPYFLVWLQKQDAKEVKELLRRCESLFSNELILGENRDRVVHSCSYLLFSMQQLSSWLQEDLNWEEDYCKQLVQSISSELIQIGNTQLAQTTEIASAQLFLKILSDLITSGRVSLANGDDFIDPRDYRQVVGRLFGDEKSNDNVYIFPSIAYAAVKEFSLKINSPFAFSQKSVSSNLARMKAFEETDENKNTKRRRAGPTNVEYWVISKDRLGLIVGKDVHSNVERDEEAPF
jgi:hypothetical protein